MDYLHLQGRTEQMWGMPSGPPTFFKIRIPWQVSRITLPSERDPNPEQCD